MNVEWSDMIQMNAEAYRELEIVNYGSEGLEQQQIFISVPKSGGCRSAVVWFHGGGMVGGGRDIPDLFYEEEFVIFEARYRLSPAYAPTVAVADAAAAVAWVWERQGKFGFDRLFLGGLSAGAYLAAMAGMDAKQLEAYGFDCRKLAGLILVSGQLTTHFQLKADLGYKESQFQPVIDDYAPLAHLAADLAPILFVTGDPALDMPARAEENAFCAASLRALGHPMVRYVCIPGVDHGGICPPSEPHIADFLKELK